MEQLLKPETVCAPQDLNPCLLPATMVPDLYGIDIYIYIYIYIEVEKYNIFTYIRNRTYFTALASALEFLHQFLCLTGKVK